MRSRAVLVLLVTVGLVGAVLATPVAAQPPEFPDERIFLLCGLDEPFDEPCDTEFAADTPFWIGHGVGFFHGQGVNQRGVVPAAGHFDFKLFVEDVEVEEDWTFHGGTVTFDVFIFPDGMGPGDVKFRAEWIGTCTFEEIETEPECEKPADTWTFITNEVTITFS